MWWQDILWGIWNGATGWVILLAHVFGRWAQYPFFDAARDGNWYAFGFLIGTGSPFFGLFGPRRRPR